MKRTDVVVVGAGIAGLTTALSLVEGGIDVVVMEARSEVGGRVRTCRDHRGRPIELGAQYIGAFHSETRKLCERLGIALEISSSKSSATELLPQVIELDGRLTTSAERQMIERWLQVSVERCLEKPPGSTYEARLSEIDVEDWLRSLGISDSAVRLFSDLPRGAQSAWALLQLISAAKGRDFFYEAEALVFPDGASILSSKLAEAIGRVRVECRRRIIELTESRNYVHVVVEERNQKAIGIDAKVVVIAVPPEAARQIRGARSIGRSVGQLTHNRQLVALVSGKAVQRMRVDAAISDGPVRLACVRPLAGSEDVISLEILVRGDSAGVLMSGDDLVMEALRLLRFGKVDLQGHWECRWCNESTSMGSYGAIPPGRRPVRNVDHIALGNQLFASDMVSVGFNGYVEGAVRSGQSAAQAACEILNASREI